MTSGEPKAASSAHVTLTSEQWELVKLIFDDAMDLRLEDQVLFVESSTSDTAVRAETLRLLGSWQKAQSWFVRASESVAELATAPYFEEGDILAGRYCIIRFIARGGMGEVYEAADQTLSGRVALKLLRPSLAVQPDLAERFRREIHLARNINSTHVCRVHDIEHHQDAAGVVFVFYTMELLAGQTLAARLRSGPPFGLSEARPLIRDMALGLDAAHRLGILHRDFKPGNVMLTPKGAVITDFGLAQDLSAIPDKLAAATPAYASPEQCAGLPQSLPADIYSFGVVLHEMFTGTLPVDGVAPSVPAIVRSCLAAEPESRPASAILVARKLGALPHPPSLRRRSLLGALLLGGVGGVAYFASYRQTTLAPGARPHRVLLHPIDGDLDTAFAIRALLVVALRQSPHLSMVSDELLRSVRGQIGLAPGVVPSPEQVRQVARLTQSTIELKGRATSGADGLTLEIAVLRQEPAGPLNLVRETVASTRAMVALADATASRVRFELGESASSLQRTHTPLEKVTSTAPEAVDAYFRAVQYYERSDAASAIVFFDRALQFDPNFAMAHAYRGLCLAVEDRLVESLAEDAEAMRLRQPLPERERLWIESLYYAGRFDYESAASVLRRLAVSDPDDSLFQRQLAFALARSCQAHAAIPFIRRAAVLDPFSPNNRGQLLMILLESNQPAEALAAYKRSREDGLISPVIDEAAALAHWLDGDLGVAETLLRQTANQSRSDSVRIRLAGLLSYQGRWQEAVSILQADLANDAAQEKNGVFVAERLLSLAWTKFLMDDPDWKREAFRLLSLPPDPFLLEQQKEAGLLGTWAGSTDVLAAAIDVARFTNGQWPTTRTNGIVALLNGCRALIESQDPAGSFDTAAGLWPVPTTHLWAGHAHARKQQWSAALHSFSAMENQAGKLIRYYVPVTRILGWLEQARSLARNGQSPKAAEIYSRVLAMWQPNAPGTAIVHRTKSELQQLTTP